jgi:hypothetical protein
VIAGSSSKKGVDEYLTLMTVAETCEYQGLDFLDFLRSREMDIETFSRRRRRYSTKKFEISSHARLGQGLLAIGNDLPVSEKFVDFLDGAT